MKTSRMIIVVVVVVIVALIALSAIATLLAPANSSPWKPAAGYPLQASDGIGVFGQQCVNSASYIYCVGGSDANGGPRNAVYASSAISSSSGNITSWTSDLNQYPQTVYGQSCVASSGYVYCVGGTHDDAGDDIKASYYAPLSGNGVVGTWNVTTPFPIYVDSQSCVASSGFIYCVGGVGEAEGTNSTSYPNSHVYYAPLSSLGIGSWINSTSSYPADIHLPSCFAADSFLYCVGGADGSGNAVSTDYYASISSSGVGAWTQTTAYPIVASGQACAISLGYVYCVGGVGSSSYINTVYYATVSSGGIGTWTKAGNYAQSVFTDCVISSGYMYCVGGADSSQVYGTTYYIPLEFLMGVTTTTSG
jgi:hypothetical protein